MFLKSGQHLRSQTYKWWPICGFLKKCPAFDEERELSQSILFLLKEPFYFVFFLGAFCFGSFLDLPNSSSSEGGQFSWECRLPLIWFKLACGYQGGHWEAKRHALAMREFGGKSVVGIPWFLHLQAALTFHQLDPVGQLPSKWYHTMVFHFNFLLLTPCFALRSAYPSVSTHAPMTC